MIIEIFILFITSNLLLEMYPLREKILFAVSIWKRFRIKMFFEVCVLISITIVIFYLLYYYVPFLNYGWLNLFIQGGGSVAISPVMSESKSSDLFIKIAVVMFFSLFLMALPSLAKSEEEAYRKGFIKWSKITKQSIKFGIVHLIMGIPIAAALALIPSGFFYAYKYRKTYLSICSKNNNMFHYVTKECEDYSILTSITYHTMYNTILIVMLLIVVSIRIFGL